MLDFTMNESSLKIIKNKEDQYNLPYLWIRDNCSCDQCRVKETQEKRFMLNAVSVDLKPKKVVIDKDIVSIEWPDNLHGRIERSKTTKRQLVCCNLRRRIRRLADERMHLIDRGVLSKRVNFYTLGAQFKKRGFVFLKKGKEGINKA